jgi:nicotinate-nucleotide--dimethylbenzimidazole phosphoribosyltransferase
MMLADTIAAVSPPDRSAGRRFALRQAAGRPAGSLGRLDDVLAQVAAVLGPEGTRPQAAISVIAADHGIATRGVTRHEASVTADVLEWIDAGDAPVAILGKRAGARVVTADFGLRRPVGHARYRVGPGTRDITAHDAMSGSEAATAVANGIDYADTELRDAGIVAVGEVGVGNTSATAALVATLLDLPPDAVVGRGAGLGDDEFREKRRLVEAACARSGADASDPMRALAAVGGFEIAGNVGVILSLAAARRVVILDGYISSASALVACALCPAARDYLVAGHVSSEPGHRSVLDALGLTPLLDLGMGLGMASGAALALELVGAAFAVASAADPRFGAETAGARR